MDNTTALVSCLYLNYIRRYEKNVKMDPNLGLDHTLNLSGSSGLGQTSKMVVVSCLYLNYIKSYEQYGKTDKFGSEIGSKIRIG